MLTAISERLPDSMWSMRWWGDGLADGRSASPARWTRSARSVARKSPLLRSPIFNVNIHSEPELHGVRVALSPASTAGGGDHLGMRQKNLLDHLPQPVGFLPCRAQGSMALLMVSVPSLK